MNANEQTIQCPNCGERFALDAAFREHFEGEKRVAISAALERAQQKSQTDQAAALQQQRVQILAEAETRSQQEQADSRAALAQLQRERDAQKVQHAAELNQLQESRDAQQQSHQQELEQIRRDANRQAEKKSQLEIQARDEEIRRLGEELAILERRTRQGSMETQGEALETWLKQQLMINCPLDSIEDVKKGQRGADLVQQVINPRLQRCGVIVWETKNTKNWSAGWLGKLREDGARVGADLLVIVSEALPTGLKNFDLIDGVWVSSVASATALAQVLRQHLLQLADLKRAMVGRDDKMQVVYAYLVSEQFRDRVQRIVDTWEALEHQVTREENAMQKQWKERRKQLRVMIDVTNDMYTDISAVIGADELPQVPGLSLSASADSHGDALLDSG